MACVGAGLGTWYNLTLAVNVDEITASVDGVRVATVHDGTFDSGSAGLGSGFHYAAFDSVGVVPLRPYVAHAAMAHTPDGVQHKSGVNRVAGNHERAPLPSAAAPPSKRPTAPAPAPPPAPPQAPAVPQLAAYVRAKPAKNSSQNGGVVYCLSPPHPRSTAVRAAKHADPA